MVLIKEYRIPMPLTVEEYRVGQLYMIARHSHEQTENGEGVETVINNPCEDIVHGKGQYTEKKIHLSSRLPYWVQSFLPKVLYVTEKAWNYYPFTITEYTCSFIPKLNVTIKTKFEDDNGQLPNVMGLTPEQLQLRIVDMIDIAYDEICPKHYKEDEDLRFFKSQKTDRGPLVENWQSSTSPIMCSYKLVEASFEVWGMQTKSEDLIQKSIREILVLGHRQAFAWIDDWIGMTLADVRLYECEMQRETNSKVTPVNGAASSDDKKSSSNRNSPSSSKSTSARSSPRSSPSSPKSPSTPKSWFAWS